MTRKLILLRHGQTEYNATRRMQGQFDTELSDVGRAQAHAVADALSGVDVRHVVASDLKRAMHTAQIVAEHYEVDVLTDPRLRETNLGQWQGKTHMEVDSAYPGARAAWRHNVAWAPPGGESRLEVAARAHAVINELMANVSDWDNGAVLVVAHGGTISALTASLLELSHEQYPMFSGLNNTCWAQLTARPRFRSDEPGEKVSAGFTAETVGDAQWYLDGWNMSAVYPHL